jgi:hypothetical protein
MHWIVILPYYRNGKNGTNEQTSAVGGLASVIHNNKAKSDASPAKTDNNLKEIIARMRAW